MNRALQLTLKAEISYLALDASERLLVPQDGTVLLMDPSSWKKLIEIV
jgi:hypothetical protein